MYLALSDGYWKQKMNGADIIWLNEPGTIATFNFTYRSGNLQKESYLAFSPAVHIWVKNGAQGLSMAIDTIFYSQVGTYLRWHVHFDNQKQKTTNPNELDKIQNVLAADLRAPSFFQGKLLTNFKKPVHLDDHLQESPMDEPFIKQLYFVSSATNPALNVELTRGATLHFSQRDNQNAFDNNITLSKNNPTYVKFDYIKYDFESNSLEGHLSEFVSNIDNGSITTGPNLFLKLLPGSSLNFNNLDFENAHGFTTLDCSSGSLNAGIGAGSRMNMTTGVPNPSYIVFDNNSSVNLAGFALNIHDKKATDVMISGGSSINLNVTDAQFGFGLQGYLDLAPGQLIANLYGTWNSSKAPDVNLKITKLDCTISGGRFILNKNTDLALVSGTIKSTDLTLSGLTYGGLTGRVNEFSAFFEKDSKFGLPNGFEIVNGSNTSQFVGATPTHNMVLEQNYPYPISAYSFDMNFKTFQNSDYPQFGLQNGNVTIRLENFDVDSIVVTNSSIGGQFDFENQDAKVKGWCSIYNIQGYETHGKPQRIGGNIKLNVYPGLSYDIHTPFSKGPGGDERQFPFNILVTSHDSTLSSEGNIAFNGRTVTIDNLNYQTSLEVIVPAGKGEHQDKDDVNSANGQHPGDDRLKSAQEIYYDHHPLICDVHIYLLPYTYTCKSKFFLQTDQNNVLSFTLEHLSLDQPFIEKVNWQKDGCDLGVLGAVGGVIIGIVTGGVGGAAVTGIIGYVAGSSLESSIKARMVGEVAQKIDSEKGTWKLINF
jgi:hypothetical protein